MYVYVLYHDLQYVLMSYVFMSYIMSYVMSYVMSYIMSLCLIPCLVSFCLLSSQNTDPGLMLTPVQDNLNAADLKVL